MVMPIRTGAANAKAAIAARRGAARASMSNSGMATRSTVCLLK